MENVRKYRDIKLVSSERRRNYLVLKPNYYTTKFFTENALAIEMEKTQITMNKPDYLSLSILDLSKTAMYKFWYDYIKAKYGEKANCVIWTQIFPYFIAHIKTEDIYQEISEDVEKRFDTSNYEIDRPLPIGKNKKVIGIMNDKLVGQIMKKFVGLRPKTYSYLKENKREENKRAKVTKKCVVKRKLQFEDYKKCLKSSQIINMVSYLEKKKLILIVLKKIKKNS